MVARNINNANKAKNMLYKETDIEKRAVFDVRDAARGLSSVAKKETKRMKPGRIITSGKTVARKKAGLKGIEEARKSKFSGLSGIRKDINTLADKIMGGKNYVIS
jgi:hypothetical protein